MSPLLASLVCTGLLELVPNPLPGGFAPAGPTAWSSWGLRTGAGCLPVVRVILASSPVLEESCLCPPGAFWEIWGPAGEWHCLGDIRWGN